MVRPEASEQGIASRLVARLLEWVRDTAPSEAVVGLFASPQAIDLYAELGFTAADEDPLGMTTTLTPR